MTKLKTQKPFPIKYLFLRILNIKFNTEEVLDNCRLKLFKTNYLIQPIIKYTFSHTPNGYLLA